MFRALYSAVSGMNNNQTAMDVIGNNIANANTIAFKASRTDFADAFYQVTRAASANAPVNTQVGLGAVTVSTPTQFTQGAFQRTDVPTDMALNGDGFFVVQNPAGTATELTRAGDFILDQGDITATPPILGYLRTQDGYYVMGDDAPIPAAGVAVSTLARIAIPMYVDAGLTELTSSFTVDSDGTITAIGQNGTTLSVAYMGVATYPNPNGLIRLGSNRYAYNTTAGSQNVAYAGGTGTAGTISQGSLELSKVDLAEEFSDMIVTQRGFDANAKTITTCDEMMQTVTNMKR